MATTTNYSWTTPDDTALVKDGAAAIRSLGTAIDTTVFNNAGAAIAKSIVDAKGDLIAGTADNTVARLASSGSNGNVLTVDTSTATGLAWAAPAPSVSGLTFITGGTISASSTINVNNCFTSTYANYKIILNLSSAGGGFIIPMRMRVSSSDTATGYNTQRYRGDDATFAGFENQDGATYWVVNGAASGTMTFGLEMDLYSPQLARNTIGLARAQSVNSTSHVFDVGCGLVLADTTQYDGFSWIPTSTVTGEYRVYGYQNS